MNFKVLSAILLLGVGVLTPNTAQNLTLSPYSNFGTGEWMGFNQAHANQANQTLSGAYSYSFLNPATLGGMKYSTLDFALNYTGGDVKSASDRQTFNGGNFSYLSLSFALYRKEKQKMVFDSVTKIKTYNKKNFKWNGAFSLLPFSTVGYNYIFQSNNTMPVNIAHSGQGGINSAGFSQGMSWNDKLHFGYGISFLFGQITDNAIFDIVDSARYFKIEDQQILNIRGLQHQFGALIKLGKFESQHSIGASLGFFSGMSAARERLARTLSPGTFGYFYEDTVLYVTTGKRKFDMPTMLGAGYTFKKGDAWLVNVDYSLQQWSNFSAYFTAKPLKNRQSVGIGFTLNPVEEKNSKKKKFPIQYRAGFRYTQTQNFFVSSSGLQTDINEWTGSLGFGLPVGRRYFDNRVLKSAVNVQLEYTERGMTTNGLAKERYFRLTLAFNLGDLWFQRNKFN